MNSKNLIISPFVLSFSILFSSCTATDTNSYTQNLGNAETTVTIQHNDTIIYVNNDAQGLNDVFTWDNAFNDLQDAI